MPDTSKKLENVLDTNRSKFEIKTKSSKINKSSTKRRKKKKVKEMIDIKQYHSLVVKIFDIITLNKISLIHSKRTVPNSIESQALYNQLCSKN